MQMDSSAAKLVPADELIFHDGLGDRLLLRDTHGKPLHESLLLKAELSVIPSFEFSLNQRLTQLDQFDHPAFVRIRKLVRVTGPLPRLSLVGDYGGGTRLSDVLTAMEQKGAPPAVGAVVFVTREILDAVSALHRQASGVAHGALAPERVMVNGTIRITDYVLGSAIEQLRFSVERYWKELRVAIPSSAGAPRLDRRSDVAQIGMIALALFAGRSLRDSEYLGNLEEVAAGLSLPAPIKSPIEAIQGLEEAISEARVQPAPLVLSGLGIRGHRAEPAATAAPVHTKTPPPAAPVKKATVRPAATADAWASHDVDASRRATGQRPSGAAAMDEARPSVFGERLKTILKVGLLGAALAGAFTAAQYVPAPAMLFSQTGTLAVESTPGGATVLVDGQEQGITPLMLKLKRGRHEVELRSGSKRRMFNVNIASGASVSQYVELTGK